jgi:hypothetical protein
MPKTGSKVDGDFPFIFRMELDLGLISGKFPVMPSKIPYFHDFSNQ